VELFTPELGHFGVGDGYPIRGPPEDTHGDRGLQDHGSNAFFAILDLLLGKDGVGDVLGDADEFSGRSVFIIDNGTGDPRPTDGTVGPEYPREVIELAGV